jgi:hypothetical protein
VSALLMGAVLLSTVEASDPITAILTRDWAAVGGWSLFIGVVILIVFGSFKGLWVPGWMYKQQGETLKEAMAQNRTLLATADLTKHFFESTAPKSEVKND